MLAGTISGCFFAWVCPTMWGLDDADPRVAIQAMQAMNASVRDPVFFPAFCLTPVVLAGAAALTWSERRRLSGRLLLAAAVTYLCGGPILTATVNVPMNEALAAVTGPADGTAARAIWTAYSSRWQAYTMIRTLVSGLAAGLAAAALIALPAVHRPR